MSSKASSKSSKATSASIDMNAMNKRMSKIENKITAGLPVDELTRMMVAPGTSNPVPTPTLHPARGAVRKFTRTFNVKSSGPGTEFAAIIRPQLHNFTSFSANNQSIHIMHPNQVNFFINSTVQGNVITDIYENHSTMLGSATTPSNVFYKYVGNLNVSGHPYDAPPDDSATVIVDSTNLPALIEIRHLLYDDTVETQTFVLTKPETDFAMTTTKQRVGFIITATSKGGALPVPATVRWSFNDEEGSDVELYLDSITLPLIQDSWVESSNRLSTYRVTAMSALFSYRGNLMESAGVIAGARVPKGWAPTEPSMYTSICKLTNDQDHYPIYKGVYGWWLPYDLSELDFISPFENNPDATELVFGGIFDDAGGALECTISVVVEFFSPLQLFEKHPFPPLLDEYVALWHSLQQLPAITCNPAHDQLTALAKVAKKGAKYAHAAYKWGQAHPQAVNSMMTALKAIGAVLI